MSKHLMNTYARLPFAFERGEGAWLWDSDGNRYLDAISSWWTCLHGHAHPRLVSALAEQAALAVGNRELIEENQSRSAELEQQRETMAQLNDQLTAIQQSYQELNQTRADLAAAIGASAGGRISPSSSLCVMISAPIRRVLTPQDVVQQYCRALSGSRYLMSKARAKFWPRLWLVPICSALPSCMRPSMQ